MEIRDFKDNIYDATGEHAKKMFIPVLATVLLTSVLFALAIIPLAMKLFPADLIEKFTSLSQDFNNIKANQVIMSGLIKENLSAFFTVYIVAIVVGLLASTYTFRFGYQISKNQLEGNNNWSRQLWNIFDSKFISTFIALVLIGVIYMGLFVLISNVARFGILAFFIGMVVLFAFVLRFAIVAPAITIGGLSIKEAFQFSLRNISWGRGFKMVLIIFVACIAIFIVMLLITLIFNLIAGNGTIGNILSNFIFLIIMATTSSLMIAASAGLFYRYGSFEEEVASGDDHTTASELIN
jgi:hypothetical protein